MPSLGPQVVAGQSMQFLNVDSTKVRVVCPVTLIHQAESASSQPAGFDELLANVMPAGDFACSIGTILYLIPSGSSHRNLLPMSPSSTKGRISGSSPLSGHLIGLRGASVSDRLVSVRVISERFVSGRFSSGCFVSDRLVSERRISRLP